LVGLLIGIWTILVETEREGVRQVKILHIIIGLGAGGAENMLRRLLESYRGDSEFQHAVVSLTDAGDLGEALVASGTEVHLMGMRGFLNAPTTAIRLARLIRRMEPDIVQTWMYHADLIGGLAARAAGKRRLIWGIRGTDTSKGTAQHTYILRRFCALLSSYIPAVIVCAAEAARNSHAAIGYDRSKMIVVPNGFESITHLTKAESRSTFRARFGWSDEIIVLGWVGRYNFDKDLENFIEAAGLLAKAFESTRFLLIGKEVDEANDKVRSLIAATGFPERFTLLGFRSDVPDCLDAMDVFCLSSRSEGFPNVVGEAMSIGTPCVATDVGDARALLADTGVIVPKENAFALYEGMVKIVEMPGDARKAMGRRAQERVTSEFSMPRVRERFKAIYRALDSGVDDKAERTPELL
jgi:glycosyltransferase involved in cell wall biosynthesis